jgi:hypothetical protein
MKLPDAHQTRLFHSDAFALYSFLAIRPHPLRDGAYSKDDRSRDGVK